MTCFFKRYFYNIVVTEMLSQLELARATTVLGKLRYADPLPLSSTCFYAGSNIRSGIKAPLRPPNPPFFHGELQKMKSFLLLVAFIAFFGGYASFAVEISCFT